MQTRLTAGVTKFSLSASLFPADPPTGRLAAAAQVWPAQLSRQKSEREGDMTGATAAHNAKPGVEASTPDAQIGGYRGRWSRPRKATGR
jgi:hypothetical protein